jgi:predicted HicB family RNase H-like nuclease
MGNQHTEVKITLRLPLEVAEGMKRSALANDRSLNGEIVRALREYLAQQRRSQ